MRMPTWLRVPCNHRGDDPFGPWGGPKARYPPMTRISLAALLFAACALAAPVQAQDPSSADPGAPPQSEASGTFDLDTGLDIAVSAEQAAAIRAFVRESAVPPVEVDFGIALGAAIPSTVTLSPLPRQIVPALEGYLFFLLPDGRIVVVSPSTLKIVLIVYA